MTRQHPTSVTLCSSVNLYHSKVQDHLRNRLHSKTKLLRSKLNRLNKIAFEYVSVNYDYSKTDLVYIHIRYLKNRKSSVAPAPTATTYWMWSPAANLKFVSLTNDTPRSIGNTALKIVSQTWRGSRQKGSSPVSKQKWHFDVAKNVRFSTESLLPKLLISAISASFSDGNV